VIAARLLVPIAIAATAAGLLVAPVASADHSQDVTMRPATIPLSFKLPFYWEREKTPRGYAFYAHADDLSADLAVIAMHGKIRNGTELGNAAADLITATYGRVDPTAQLQVSRVELPIGTGIRTLVRYHQTANGLTSEALAVLYFVSHGSRGYVFMFRTGLAGLAGWEPIFRYTAKSIRYTGSSL
jgi:hypothetical protein